MNLVSPRCKHFCSCGGCTAQDIPYEEQLQRKEAFVRSLFPNESEATFFPIMSSVDVWEYRNKMEFTFSQTSKGEQYLGLILKSSRGLVFNLEECFLTDAWFADTLASVRTWWRESGLHAYWHGKDKGSLRTLTLRRGITSGDRMAILTVSGNPDYALKQHHLDSFKKAIGEGVSIVLRIHQCIKGSPTQFYEMILQGPDHIREHIHGLEFHISPSAFFQPNTKTAAKLYERALELAAIDNDAVVYDLYCGIGIFGMCAARYAKKVIGIELNRDAAYDAKVNSDRLQLANFTIYAGDVGKVLQEKGSELPRPDVVIVDPPRPGLDPKAIEQLVALKPKKILYVSCNPVTQAANLTKLEEHGYVIQYIQPVDQFPHTPHVENIVVCSC
jgi:23S rRNA (uracil1939-C5)-methyltransferase